MSTSPWGCAPDTAADEAVVFHDPYGLIFQSLNTLDETVILESAAVASVDGDLLAEQCLRPRQRPRIPAACRVTVVRRSCSGSSCCCPLP